MKIHTQKDGFTLVEIIISIVILGIILVPLIGVFTNSFTNIINMGNKTRAMAKAEAVMDYIYSEGTYDPLILTSIFNINNKVDNIEESIYNPEKPINYSVSECNINGEIFNKVTILVYYQKGKRNITLSTLIP